MVVKFEVFIKHAIDFKKSKPYKSCIAMYSDRYRNYQELFWSRNSKERNSIKKKV